MTLNKFSKMSLIAVAAIMLSTTYAGAQTPESFNYQAALRDNTGAVLSAQSVSMRFTIRGGSTTGTVLYQETNSSTTTAEGLINLKIGSGTVVSGTFSTIDWATGTKFLQVEADLGTGYVDLGTQQLVSTPYALYSKNAGKATNMNLDDLVNVNAGSPTVGQVIKWNGTQWVPDTDNTGSGSLTGGTGISISGGVVSAQNTTAQWNANQLQGQNISTTAPTSGQVLKWNGTAWQPDTDNTGGGGGQWTLNGAHIYNSNVGGFVGIKEQTPLSDLHIEESGGAATAQGTGGINLENGTYHWRIYNSNDYVRYNYSNNSGTSYTPKAYVNSLDGSWNIQSDARIKKDVTPFKDVLPLLVQLQAYTYHYIDNKESDPKSYGFMAQDIQKLFPEVVSHEKEEDLLGVDYAKFSVLAVKAIQEQQVIIEQLKERIEKLENK